MTTPERKDDRPQRFGSRTPAKPAADVVKLHMAEHVCARETDRSVVAARTPEGSNDNEAPEQPSSAAVPFTPRPPHVMAAYIAASLIIALTQGLGMSFMSVNLPSVAGSLGATTNEATWLLVAYLVPNASLTLLLFKIRAQYGIRNFAEVAIVVYVLVSLAHLWVDDMQGALIARFFAGVAASPMTSLAFLYMLETFAPEKKLNIGLCLALTALALPTPVAGLLSPMLLDLGGWHVLYIAEMGLAMVSAGLIYLLPLTSPPRAKVIGLLDIVSYVFIAAGMAALATFLVTGPRYWWGAAPWLGIVLACGIAAFTVVAVIELNRETPLLDIRWLTSKEIVHFTGALLIFRLILSEQSSGARAFFQQMGLSNAQMDGFYWVVLGATVIAGLVCASLMKPGREPALHVVALTLLAVGSFMDSQVTATTRPEQMYLSQIMIGFASGLFLPPALAVGFKATLARGPNYILSFIIVFLTTQKLGGIFGSAAFSSFVTLREQFHSNMLVQSITATDPLVSERVAQLSAGYAPYLADAAIRGAQGVSALAQAVRQQAYVLAYEDAFFATGCLALFALACLVAHLAYRQFMKLTAPEPAT